MLHAHAVMLHCRRKLGDFLRWLEPAARLALADRGKPPRVVAVAQLNADIELRLQVRCALSPPTDRSAAAPGNPHAVPAMSCAAVPRGSSTGVPHAGGVQGHRARRAVEFRHRGGGGAPHPPLLVHSLFKASRFLDTSGG
jgi:hypothetical protein